MAAASCLGIGVALALPLLLYLALDNLRGVGDVWSESGGVTVFLSHDIAPAAEQRVLKTVAETEGVGQVRHYSQGQALEEFASWSGYEDILNGLEQNPLPAVLLVELGETAPAAVEVERLRRQLDAMPEVDYAVADLDWVRRLKRVIGVTQRLVIVVGLLLIVAAVLTVFYNIHLLVSGRRDEIRVIKLVGGTNGFIRRPFLHAGFSYGLCGGLVALLIIIGTTLWLQEPVSNLLSLYGSDHRLRSITLGEGLGLVLFASALGLVGAWLSVTIRLQDIEPDFEH